MLACMSNLLCSAQVRDVKIRMNPTQVEDLNLLMFSLFRCIWRDIAREREAKGCVFFCTTSPVKGGACCLRIPMVATGGKAAVETAGEEAAAEVEDIEQMGEMLEEMGEGCGSCCPLVRWKIFSRGCCN